MIHRASGAGAAGPLVLLMLAGCKTPTGDHESMRGEGDSARPAQSDMPGMTATAHDDMAADPAPSDAQGMKDMRPRDRFAEPFFTHMGVPMAPGEYSTQFGGTVSRVEGQTDVDATARVMTGLTDSIGVVLVSDGVRYDEHAEAMFQWAAVRSDDRRSGFSPILEFEIPTHAGGDRRTHTLVGFSTALGNSDVSFNQAIHFDVNNPEFEGSASLAARLFPRVFPTVEVIGEGARGEKPIVNVLAGVKFRVDDNLMLGIALEKPVTDRRDFTSRLMLTLDIGW
jgi:hypothetical protein